MPEQKGTDWVQIIWDGARIIQQENYTWLVEIALPKADMTDLTLSAILKTAKRKISQNCGVPYGMLSYEKLIKKDLESDSPYISAVFARKDPERGITTVRFEKGVSKDGREYDDIELYLDLYPLDMCGEPTSVAGIKELLRSKLVALELVDEDILERAFNRLQSEPRAIKNLLVARGKLPFPGEDASVKFLCELKKLSVSESIGIIKTKAKTVVCRKKHMKPSKDGLTVRGTILTPPQPWDILVETGDFVGISPGGSDYFTYIDGLVNVKTEDVIGPKYKSKITISVEPLEVVDGSAPVKISTDKTVEITGGLKAGSQVVSEGNVFIKGNIENGTTVTTGLDIIVTGNVNESSLSSDRDIERIKDVKSSRLSAKGRLEVLGKVSNSELSGREVLINEVCGSTIVAGSKLEINRITSDAEGNPTVIKAGTTTHKKTLVGENQKYIDFARINLKKFIELFGDSVVSSVNPSNVSKMILEHTKNLRKKGSYSLTDEKADALRRIMLSISPMRNLMVDRVNANKKIKKEIRTGTPGDSVVIVKNPVDDSIQVFMEDLEQEITSADGSTMIKYCQGSIEKIKWEEAGAGEEAGI